jgi:hypothetical protein
MSQANISLLPDATNIEIAMTLSRYLLPAIKAYVDQMRSRGRIYLQHQD